MASCALDSAQRAAADEASKEAGHLHGELLDAKPIASQCKARQSGQRRQRRHACIYEAQQAINQLHNSLAVVLGRGDLMTHQQQLRGACA